MASKKSNRTNRSTLIEGCGTILKSNRLTHGYSLVKRKKVIGSSSEIQSTPKRKAGRPKSSVSTTASAIKRKAGRPKSSVSTTARTPKRKAGRPAKSKIVATITEKVVLTSPKRKAGRPRKMVTANIIASAPTKRKAGRPKLSVSSPASAMLKRRGKRKSKLVKS